MKAPKKKFVYQLDTVFKFGKHKGETIERVITYDANYIQWCKDEVENFELDVKAHQLWDVAMEAQEEMRIDREWDSDFRDAFDF